MLDRGREGDRYYREIEFVWLFIYCYNNVAKWEKHSKILNNFIDLNWSIKQF